MAKEGLNATGYRGWISQDINVDSFTSKIFSEFVLTTPAYGISVKGRNLYDYYGFCEPGDYVRLKNDLIGKIDEINKNKIA